MDEIVVGVGGTPTAHEAARRAAELASALGVGLHIVTSVKRHGANVSAHGERWHIDSFSAGEQLLDSLGVEFGIDPTTKSVQTGDAADALCEEAARLDAQMIVVGNRRVQGAARVLGSVATHVARHAGCDVLIAHTTGVGTDDAD